MTTRHYPNGTLYLNGKPIKVSDFKITIDDSAPPEPWLDTAAPIVRATVQSTFTLDGFSLTSPEDPVEALMQQCTEHVCHSLHSELGDDYFVQVVPTYEVHRNATNIMVRVQKLGAARAIAAMSYNYWHKHVEDGSLPKIRKRLDKRLKKFCETTRPRLKSSEHWRAKEAKEAARHAALPGKLAAAIAETEAVFEGDDDS